VGCVIWTLVTAGLLVGWVAEYSMLRLDAAFSPVFGASGRPSVQLPSPLPSAVAFAVAGAVGALVLGVATRKLLRKPVSGMNARAVLLGPAALCILLGIQYLLVRGGTGLPDGLALVRTQGQLVAGVLVMALPALVLWLSVRGMGSRP
jgi:hypothetical protein